MSIMVVLQAFCEFSMFKIIQAVLHCKDFLRSAEQRNLSGDSPYIDQCREILPSGRGGRSSPSPSEERHWWPQSIGCKALYDKNK